MIKVPTNLVNFWLSLYRATAAPVKDRETMRGMRPFIVGNLHEIYMLEFFSKLLREVPTRPSEAQNSIGHVRETTTVKETKVNLRWNVGPTHEDMQCKQKTILPQDRRSELKAFRIWRARCWYFAALLGYGSLYPPSLQCPVIEQNDINAKSVENPRRHICCP